MACEMLYDFAGGIILFDNKKKKEVARLVVYPKNEEGKPFLGIITKQDVQVILDSDSDEQFKAQDLCEDKINEDKNKLSCST